MEIPTSLGLTPQPRDDGKLNLVGKADDGSPYVARVTGSNEVAESDIAALVANDREHTDARTFCRELTERITKGKEQQADDMYHEFLEPADRVAFAGTHKGSRTLGYSRQYAANFDTAFGGQ